MALSEDINLPTLDVFADGDSNQMIILEVSGGRKSACILLDY